MKKDCVKVKEFEICFQSLHSISAHSGHCFQKRVTIKEENLAESLRRSI